MFYINTDKAPASEGEPKAFPFGRRPAATNHKYELSAPLPADWENKWHHVEACYDGKKMTVSIDKTEVAQMEAQGNIINAPFPVNIGRNEQTHGQDTHVYICDALMDNVVIADNSGQLLNLDFETEQQEGSYFSYGIGARTYGTISAGNLSDEEIGPARIMPVAECRQWYGRDLEQEPFPQHLLLQYDMGTLRGRRVPAAGHDHS